MERGVVRSSARLSCGNGTASSNGNSNGSGSGAAETARRAAAAALAAERRARAAERAREVEDSPRELRDKCRVLARAVRQARHLVVYTGAGISTAADIPDYRGPRGVWTRLQRGEDIGRVEVSRARPTFTHMALAALVARGLVKFVVSQNCDGLHVRAGLPRRALAELHGDMFAERCAAPRCRRVLLRAFDTTQRTRRYAHGTRRTCPAPRCGRPLRDTIVHFGERARAAWPLNWAGALRHAAAADVILCLGSSLKVLRRYPALWSMARPAHARPRLYIVNLQWTPKDAGAALKINARCDAVLRELARRLRLRVPRYRAARDPLLAHATPLAPAEAHTCSRPALPALPVPAEDASDEPDDSDDSGAGSGSGSGSDSDDALPLRCLQERLRGPAPRDLEPDLKPDLEPDIKQEYKPDIKQEYKPELEPEDNPRVKPELDDDEDLESFEVSLASGPARVLLRARHAPSGKRQEDEGGGGAGAARGGGGGGGAGARLRRLLAAAPRPHPAPPPDDAAELLARSAAAAFFARAVLVCRAQLYPGLHTIIAPAPPPRPCPRRPAPAPAPPECAWCARRFGARRCLWYPRLDPLAPGRVWRRARGRRYLCTCCPRDEDAAPEPDDGGEGGWYGKGYRKGRRRRR